MTRTCRAFGASDRRRSSFASSLNPIAWPCLMSYSDRLEKPIGPLNSRSDPESNSAAMAVTFQTQPARIPMAKRVVKAKTRVVLPKMFIGSSAESIEVAEVARKVIAPYATALTWRDSPDFEPSQSTLAGLLNAIESYDFALFVLSLDDRLKLRGRQTVCIRDNVLFEFGLFLGHLGAERVAAIMQSPNSDEEVRVPSDIVGITISRFAAHKDRVLLIGSVSSALDGFLTRVKTQGRRRKNIGLIRGYGFDSMSRAFSVGISSLALQENWKKCENCSLVLVARVHSDDAPYEDDIRISTGPAPAFPDRPKRLRTQGDSVEGTGLRAWGCCRSLSAAHPSGRDPRERGDDRRDGGKRL